MNKFVVFIKELNELLKQRKQVILAIDGECASLKTTLAQVLETVYGAGVIHCDNFFLPPDLRTPERFEEAGGNIDYIRLKEEVIDKLNQKEEITYQPFDCHAMRFADEVCVKKAKLMIVEGAYAMHPQLGKYYDMALFLSAKESERIKRISARGQSAEHFINRWIPLENRYFEVFHIRKRADFLIDTTDITNLAETIIECSMPN